jgi:hypothetical protein
MDKQRKPNCGFKKLFQMGSSGGENRIKGQGRGRACSFHQPNLLKQGKQMWLDQTSNKA